MENAKEKLLTPEMIERLRKATATHNVDKVLYCHGLYNKRDRNAVSSDLSCDIWEQILADGYLVMSVGLGDTGDLLLTRHLLRVSREWGSDVYTKTVTDLAPDQIGISDDGWYLKQGTEAFSASTPLRHRLFKRLYDELELQEQQRLTKLSEAKRLSPVPESELYSLLGCPVYCLHKDIGTTPAIFAGKLQGLNFVDTPSRVYMDIENNPEDGSERLAVSNFKVFRSQEALCCVARHELEVFLERLRNTSSRELVRVLKDISQIMQWLDKSVLKGSDDRGTENEHRD